MVTLADIRDFSKGFKLFEYYFTGRVNSKKENSLGVFQIELPKRETIDHQGYKVKAISFLIYGNKNNNETEILAQSFYTALETFNTTDANIGGKKLFFIELLQNEPIDVTAGKDGGVVVKEVYEYVIEAKFYLKR